MARASKRNGWASCPLTENGFLRIVSNPGYPRALRLADAIAVLDAQLHAGGHAFWSDEISISDASVFDHAHLLGPSQITDAYLLATAVKNGGRLVSFDRRIASFAVRSANASHLVTL